MNLEDRIREAIVAELKRQSEGGGRKLKIEASDQTMLVVEGPVNLDELSMVIVGALAGGP